TRSNACSGQAYSARSACTVVRATPRFSASFRALARPTAEISTEVTSSPCSGRLLTDLCSEEARSDVLLCDTIVPWFATSRIIELAPRVPAWLVTSAVVTYFVGAVLAFLQEQVPKFIGKAEISIP